MKSHSLLRIAAAFTLTLAAFSADAQIAKANVAAPASFTTTSPVDADEVILGGLKLSNEKMYRSLMHRFSSPSGIGIHKGVKNTAITFKQDDMRHNVLFTNKGAWLQTIRYYEIDKLNKSVTKLVQAEFPDFDLLRATEVTIGATVAYLVDIETPKRFKVIRVVNGEWDVYQEFNKQR